MNGLTVYPNIVARRGQTPVECAHGMVIRLHWQLLLSVPLDPDYKRVGRGKGNVPHEDGLGLMDVGLAVEDGLGIDWYCGPAVKGDGVDGLGHCAGADILIYSDLGYR